MWLNWVDGITTTESELDVIVGFVDANTKDDVSLRGDDVTICNDENGADDVNNVVIDDVMTLEVISCDDWAKKYN